jgi:Do/DeqQ family serine protease
MRKLLTVLIACVLSSLLSLFLYSQFMQPRQADGGSGSATARYTGMIDRLFAARSGSYFTAAAPNHFTEAAARTTPAVVNISAAIRGGSSFFGSEGSAGSTGSGVILSPDGYIVTNHHVIEGSSAIQVTLSDKGKYKATVIGSDASTDIALIKIDADELPFIVFGNSDSLRIGEWVLAVGNPFNLESTVTAGIVSAKGRNINILGGGASIESFIQTDAAVNPGNSGGALVNTLGELVGINTAIMSETGSYEGYSFAVPSNLARKVIDDLRKHGAVQRAFLGITIEDVTAEIAKELGLKKAEGVVISRVNPGGGADNAGLTAGDIIVGLNDIALHSTPELQEMVGRLSPGDKVAVEYIRNGQRSKVYATLMDANNRSGVGSAPANTTAMKELGFELRDITRAEFRQFKQQGVLVVSVLRGSIIHTTNMQSGFLITKINGTAVASVEQARQLLGKVSGKISIDGYYQGSSDLYSYRFNKN